MAVAALVIALAGCASAPRPRVLARGTLPYALASAGGRLVSIELDERFALFVRDPDVATPLCRIDLGAAERDLPALAVAGTRAWVGGDDGVVRAIDLERGAVIATWPVGAAVTALAAGGGLVAIGDATGVVCLRRVDGALLQCLALGDAAIRELALRDDTLWVTAAQISAWRLPALTRVAARRPATMWADGEVVVAGPTVELARRDGNRRLARMDGPVRAVAVLPGGRLAIAAWVRALDNPSIIVLAPLN